MSRPRFLLFLWLFTDLLIFLGSYSLAYFLRLGWIFSTDLPFPHYFLITAMVAPLWLAVLASTGLFHLTRNQATIRSFLRILYSGVMGIALFTLVFYFHYSIFFSRLLLMLAFTFHTAGTWIWHLIFDDIRRTILRRDPPCFPTLIVGITRETKRLITLLKDRKSPLRVVALLDSTGAKETAIDDVPVMGKLNKLEEVLDRYKITHVIQCSDVEQTINLLSCCRERGITYMLLPSVLGIVERDEVITSLEGKPVAMVAPPRGLSGTWFY